MWLIGGRPAAQRSAREILEHKVAVSSVGEEDTDVDEAGLDLIDSAGEDCADWGAGLGTDAQVEGVSKGVVLQVRHQGVAVTIAIDVVVHALDELAGATVLDVDAGPHVETRGLRRRWGRARGRRGRGR